MIGLFPPFSQSETTSEEQTGIKANGACDYIAHDAAIPPIVRLEIFPDSYISEQILLILW